MARTSIIYYILYLAVGFLYPAYASIHAIETPDPKDDSIWLIYWIVFATFSILEFATDYIFFWFPFYSLSKVVFLLWCTAPIHYNGAYYVYKLFLQPFFHEYGKGVDPLITDVLTKASEIIPPYPS